MKCEADGAAQHRHQQQMEHRIVCCNNYAKVFCGRKRKVSQFDTFGARPALELVHRMETNNRKAIEANSLNIHTDVVIITWVLTCIFAQTMFSEVVGNRQLAQALPSPNENNGIDRKVFNKSSDEIRKIQIRVGVSADGPRSYCHLWQQVDKFDLRQIQLRR